MENSMRTTGRMRIQHPPMQQIPSPVDPVIRASIDYFEAYYAFVIRTLANMVKKEENN